MEKLKTYFNWSSGKDSSLALHYLLQDNNYHVDHLLTSVNSFHDRVSMHGVRRTLLEEQIRSIGIAGSTIELPEQPSMQEYESIMKAAVMKLWHKGYKYAAFGDIFLEDLKTYREQQLQQFDVRAVFPIWKKNTTELLHEFIGLGFKAIVVCVNAALLDQSFTGRIIDSNFVNDLPAGVDPCGENGEFHTFCFEGPIFKKPVSFTIGDKVYREYKTPENQPDEKMNGADKQMGFWFCDLLPVENTIFSDGVFAV